MKKGQIFEGIYRKSLKFPNKRKSICDRKKDRYVIVKNGIPGQKVKFIVNKFKSGNAEGRLLEVLEKSEKETRTPVCSIFPACGGCMYQTMSYEDQMQMKGEQVREILESAMAPGKTFTFEGVKASPKNLVIVIRWNSHLEMNIRTDHCHWDFIKRKYL